MSETGTCAVRYIPACAGETQVFRLPVECLQVHPRVCGGNTPSHFVERFDKGTSPRVRGKRNRVFRVLLFLRYIPACAGET